MAVAATDTYSTIIQCIYTLFYYWYYIIFLFVGAHTRQARQSDDTKKIQFFYIKKAIKFILFSIIFFSLPFAGIVNSIHCMCAVCPVPFIAMFIFPPKKATHFFGWTFGSFTHCGGHSSTHICEIVERAKTKIFFLHKPTGLKFNVFTKKKKYSDDE